MGKPEKNWLEWTVFAIGLILVVATLGYLVRESVAGDHGPPEVVARLGTPRSAASGFLVPVHVANHGRTTAEDVQVPIELELADGHREEARLSVAFLPHGSHRSGWVTFQRDPRGGRLRVGAIAFQEP